MQSNSKILEGLSQKIKSPLQQIRNRAITTLYTKVSAKIITEVDLAKSKELPGVLFHWINENSPINKECLFKVLSILFRYTLTEDGVKLLADYQAMEFLEEFRRFLMSNQTNVDEHCDIIKKIIKLLLPLENNRKQANSQQEELQDGQENIPGTASRLNQQQVQDDSQNEAQQSPTKQSKLTKTTQKPGHSKTTQKPRHILTFTCLSDSLPKPIDEELYSLLIQLKHGKKQTVLETLVKIEEIVAFWGYKDFRYKDELVRQLVTVIEGKIYSEVACRIIGILIGQLLQMQEDIGGCENDENVVNQPNDSSFRRNHLKTTKISSKGLKTQFRQVSIQLKFQIFQQNPFTHIIVSTMLTSNPSPSLPSSVIEYLLIALQRFPFCSSFLPSFLSKLSNNKKWLEQKLSSNKYYQEELMRMVNHCCEVQGNIYEEVIPFLVGLFPDRTLEQISRKIPSLQGKLQEVEIQRAFDVLAGYEETRGSSVSLTKQSFDFNLQLHHLQSHIKNLEKGIPGLPKNPSTITLYIDCLLTLAISVAKQDPLMSFYPKVKSLIMRISQHEFLNCRIALFDFLLLTFNSSEKVNYLAQSYLKSEVVRLVFSDAEFFGELFESALNQEETIGGFLEIAKLVQVTTKEENRKYLNKFAPIFYLLSSHSPKNGSSSIGISPAAKTILSRINKKYQITNILLSLFSRQEQERFKTYVSILGLSQTDDLMALTSEYLNLPERKQLKYSLSTIMNYMNIIMNQKIENQIKASAIEEMIECTQRIDLSLLQKDNDFLKEIFSIRSSVESYIKDFVQKPDKTDQMSFFIQLVRIYSILQKRLRLETNYLNQTIKSLAPEFYLNILINICGAVNQETLANQTFRYVIPQFLALIYYHCFKTFTSDLLMGKDRNEIKKNAIKVHWVTEIFPHEILIKTEIQEITSIPKRTEFVSTQKSQSSNKEKQKLIDNFLKGFKLNLKSHKQLIDLYIQSCSDLKPLGQQTLKLRKNIICPIIERQLSASIHNITSAQGQIAFLSFILQSFAAGSFPFQPSKQKFFQPLQEIVPHLMNQLLKPNVPPHIKILLINISNTIGWKRTKNFDGLIQQLSSQEMYYLKLVYRLPKLGCEQMARIIKTTLSGNSTDNIGNFASITLLWKTLLKPSNLKTLVLQSTEYTQLLVLNSLTKCIQNPITDQRLINFSTILLHQVLTEVFFQARKLPQGLLTNFNNDFDDANPKENKKIIEMVKLIISLSIAPNLMSFIVKMFQKNSPYEEANQEKLTLQNLCFLLEVIKNLLSISNFVTENQLYLEDLNLIHQNKLLKLFIITIHQYIRAIPQSLTLPSMQMFFTSLLNFTNSLYKLQNFQQSAAQADFLDLGLTMFNEKAKLLAKGENIEKINRNSSETFLLLSSVLEYSHLRIQSQPSQTSHYLLSSTNLLQSSLNLLTHLTTNQFHFTQSPSKTKIYIRQLLQKVAKVFHIISLYQEDYFVFKLNQLSQQQMPGFGLLETFGSLIGLADENWIVCLMRLVLVWEKGGEKDGGKGGVKANKQAQFEALNPLECFVEESEDDSSLEERELFQNSNPSNQAKSGQWIQQVVDIAVQKNYIKHCKSLLALSLPAKMFLISKPNFLQYIKRMSNLIDSKIIYESTTANKKKPVKKPPTQANNSSVLLSNSRRTVLSQNQSCISSQDQMRNSTQEQKLAEIEEFTKLLISLFAVHEGLLSSEKIDTYVNSFVLHLNKHKEVLRKIFYIVDKLYTLSELLVSCLNPNKEFLDKFMKLINALSESVIFSQSLSNHLTQVASPMLEQSLSTMLKGISQPLYQQDSQKLKQALKLLTTLSNHESVRSYIYKNKLIEELNARIIKYEEKKNDKTDYLNMNSLYDIVGFYITLSRFKDSHTKILNDKKVLQVLTNQVYMQKSSLVSQKILELLSNLSAYKLNKAMFMQNRQIHKTILGQLQSDEIEYKCHLLTLLYNLIYRHAPGVKLYKRKDVVEIIEAVHWEKCENYEATKHVYKAVLEVLTSDTEVPEKA